MKLQVAQATPDLVRIERAAFEEACIETRIFPSMVRTGRVVIARWVDAAGPHVLVYPSPTPNHDGKAIILLSRIGAELARLNGLPPPSDE